MAQPLAFTSSPNAARAAPRSWWGPMNPPLRDWRGRRVWVLGASSGIGEATAEALARRGAQVLVSARNVEALTRFAARHPATADRRAAQPWPLDVGDPEAVERVAQALWADGPVDMVLLCAGHYRAQRATAFDLADMERHLHVNYRGALHMLQATLPRLLAQGHGHLSFISSVAGFRGLPNSLAYGPTKAALTHLAEVLYLDLAPHGLGVSVVHPGFVRTPLTQQNTFDMPALIGPSDAAEAMLAGWAEGDFEIHFPKRFTRAMKLMRLLPYRAYFPLVQRFTGQ